MNKIRNSIPLDIAFSKWQGEKIKGDKTLSKKAIKKCTMAKQKGAKMLKKKLDWEGGNKLPLTLELPSPLEPPSFLEVPLSLVPHKPFKLPLKLPLDVVRHSSAPESNGPNSSGAQHISSEGHTVPSLIGLLAAQPFTKPIEIGFAPMCPTPLVSYVPPATTDSPSHQHPAAQYLEPPTLGHKQGEGGPQPQVHKPVAGLHKAVGPGLPAAAARS